MIPQFPILSLVQKPLAASDEATQNSNNNALLLSLFLFSLNRAVVSHLYSPALSVSEAAQLLVDNVYDCIVNYKLAGSQKGSPISRI